MRHRALPLLGILLTLAIALPAAGVTNSARYKFEGNRWLSLDLAVEDIRTDTIKFEWPSTLLGFKTGYKATVKVVNGSTRQASIGVAIALFDADNKLVGVGSTGTRVGTLSPGDSADFTVEIDHVTERLNQATQFQIALQTR